MRILVLGAGKTGSLVAQIAAEHHHSVHVLDAKENVGAAALTAPFVSTFDAVIDFTTPEAVIPNLRACLAIGAKVVVGTTGWYTHLAAMQDLAARKGASLLHGTNFSIGVQVMLQLAKKMSDSLPGYNFTIEETHHATKLDAPSGTAISIQQAIASAGHAEIASNRIGEVSGLHVLTATSDADRLTLTHEAFNRRGFAEGAVRAAEWLTKQKPGSYDFRDVFSEI